MVHAKKSPERNHHCNARFLLETIQSPEVRDAKKIKFTPCTYIGLLPFCVSLCPVCARSFFFLRIGGLNARSMMVKSAAACGWLVHSAHHMMMRHGKNIEQETYQNLESKSSLFKKAGLFLIHSHPISIWWIVEIMLHSYFLIWKWQGYFCLIFCNY